MPRKNGNKSRENQAGGVYVKGRPLRPSVRQEIINRFTAGEGPTAIASALQITPSCACKIINKFKKTGSCEANKIGGSKPKVATPAVLAAIEKYKTENPKIFAQQIKDRLVADGVCSLEKVPSVCSINRVIKDKLKLHKGNRGKSVNNRTKKQAAAVSN